MANSKSTSTDVAPPTDPMSFPPGLIPRLVKDKLELDDPYHPLSTRDVEEAGLPASYAPNAYLSSRLDKFYAELQVRARPLWGTLGTMGGPVAGSGRRSMGAQDPMGDPGYHGNLVGMGSHGTLGSWICPRMRGHLGTRKSSGVEGSRGALGGWRCAGALEVPGELEAFGDCISILRHRVGVD
jgi:hypothetical protein